MRATRPSLPTTAWRLQPRILEATTEWAAVSKDDAVFAAPLWPHDSPVVALWLRLLR